MTDCSSTGRNFSIVLARAASSEAHIAPLKRSARKRTITSGDRRRSPTMRRSRSRMASGRRHADGRSAPGENSSAPQVTSPPVTADGRYIVVKGRLWRTANPELSPDRRQELVNDLMAARRAVGQAERTGDFAAEAKARDAVHAAKVSLGERGPVWWVDGAPDLNQRMAKKPATPNGIRAFCA
jgi:hypothetical protein